MATQPNSFVSSFTWLLSRLEFGYSAVLPFLGFLALGYYETPGMTVTILFGWIILLLHQILRLPWISPEYLQKPHRMIFPLAPIVLIGVSTWMKDAHIWSFFIEEMVIQVLSTAMAFAIGLSFFGKKDGSTAWKDLGPGIVVLNLIFVGLGGYGFIAGWWVINMPMDPWVWIPVAGAFISATYGNVITLRMVFNGKLVIKEIFEGKEWLIIVQVFFWILGIPLINWLVFG